MSAFTDRQCDLAVASEAIELLSVTTLAHGTGAQP